MRLVGLANRYVAETEPFRLKSEEERPRLATVLWTLAQAVADLNLMLSPFLPFSANKVDQIFGGDGQIAPLPVIEEVTDLDVTNDDGSPRQYPVITGDYTHVPTWGRHDVVPGTPVAKPKPVFVKLDPSVVDEELERLGIQPE